MRVIATEILTTLTYKSQVKQTVIIFFFQQVTLHFRVINKLNEIVYKQKKLFLFEQYYLYFHKFFLRFNFCECSKQLKRTTAV